MSASEWVLRAGQDTIDEFRERWVRRTVLALLVLSQALTIVAQGKTWPFAVSLYGLSVTAFALLLWFLARWRRVSLWAASLGFLCMMLLALWWLQYEGLVPLLIIPAMVVSLLLGAQAGMAVSLAITVLVVAGIPFPIAKPLEEATLVCLWGTQAIMHGVLTDLWEMVERSSTSYTDMRQRLEKARDQQLQLRQAQQDLVHANAELARLSDRLGAMRHLAEEARRVKEEFLANVSHELRTPLNMIIGFSEMITQSPDVYGTIPPKLLADIEVIQSNSLHLAGLVNDVLDLSQVDAGRMSLSKEWVPMRDLVTSAVATVRPLFSSKGLEVHQDVQEEFDLYCDRTRIRQVIVNLLSNAGRFAEQGGARIEVRRENGRVVVSVSDSGPGIAPQDQERIFEPFEQATSGLRRHGGSGLGLAISRRFVELHGGRMWLESELGEGSTFHFALPITQEQPPVLAPITRWFNPHQPYEPRTRPSMAPQPKAVPRFVVLEPGDGLQRLVDRYWNGADVAVTRNLDQAVTELSRLPAQALIVSDHSLQDLPPALRCLTDLPFGTPVVLCWLPDRREASERLGLVDYVVKPVNRNRLLAVLDSLGRPVHTILIADDEMDALQLFSRMLSSSGRGYRVLRATSGQQALGLLRQRRPDVLLLDLMMPDMDGYALLGEKSRDPKISGIPVVAVTAQDPAQGFVATSFMMVARSGGLQLQDLLSSIQAVSSIWEPSKGGPDRELPGKPAG